MKNYGIDRILSRDIYFPSFATLAISPSLTTLPSLHIASGDLMSFQWTQKGNRYFCIDLRSEKELGGGSLPAHIRVEGKLWKNPLLLEGVLKCLEGVKHTHTICVMHYGHPERMGNQEEEQQVMDCVRYEND